MGWSGHNLLPRRAVRYRQPRPKVGATNLGHQSETPKIPHPALIADDYLLTNARVSFLSGDDRWLAELWVRNLADEEWVPTVFDLSVFNGLIIEIVGQPRWVGGSITYRW